LKRAADAARTGDGSAAATAAPSCDRIQRWAIRFAQSLHQHTQQWHDARS